LEKDAQRPQLAGIFNAKFEGRSQAVPQLRGAQLHRFSCIFKFKFQMSKFKMENKASDKNILKLPFIFSLKLAHCPN